MLHVEPLRWWIVDKYPDVELKEITSLKGKSFLAKSKIGRFAVLRDTEYEVLVWVFKAYVGTYGELNRAELPCPKPTEKPKLPMRFYVLIAIYLVGLLVASAMQSTIVAVSALGALVAASTEYISHKIDNK